MDKFESEKVKIKTIKNINKKTNNKNLKKYMKKSKKIKKNRRFFFIFAKKSIFLIKFERFFDAKMWINSKICF